MAIGTSLVNTFNYGITTGINEVAGLVQDTRKGFHLVTNYFDRTQDKRVELANAEMTNEKKESTEQCAENRIMRLSRIGDKLPHLKNVIEQAQNSIVKETWNIEPTVVEEKKDNNVNNDKQ
jgi:hypothetical protein